MRTQSIILNSKKEAYLEIILVQHCNLKCRYCVGFHNISKPHIYEFEDLKKDLEQIKSSQLNLTQVTLSGGEPLLYKKIIDVLYYIKTLYKNINMDIVTNGKLISKMDETFWKALQDTNCNLSYTPYYNSGIDYENLTLLCKKHNIQCLNTSLQDADNCQYKVKKYMIQQQLSKNIKLNKYQTKRICQKDCVCLWKGNIYQCRIMQSAYVLKEIYGVDFKLGNNDKLSVYDKDLKNKYFKYILSTPEFCKYCYNTEYKYYLWSNDKAQRIDFIDE